MNFSPSRSWRSVAAGSIFFLQKKTAHQIGTMSLTWSRGSARDVIGSRHTFLAMGRRQSNLITDQVCSTPPRKRLIRHSSAFTSSTNTGSSSPVSESKLACFDRTNLDRVQMWPKKPYFEPKEYDPKQILKCIGTKCGPLRPGTAFWSPYFCRFRIDYHRPHAKLS